MVHKIFTSFIRFSHPLSNEDRIFPKRLKQLNMNGLYATRKLKGLTQDKLSDLTGIAQAYLSEIERGVNTANQLTREKIERVLGPVDWIETGSVRLRETSYFKAERLLKRVVELTMSMEKSQRDEFTKLLCKYFKLRRNEK